MSEATLRLRNMRPYPRQSLAELMAVVADEADASRCALRDLYNVALQYLPAHGDAYAAMEAAIAALATAGDAEAIRANQEIGIIP